jgi:hypothetical protein
MWEKHIERSAYEYCLSNPIRYIDPTGATEEERLAAVEKIKTL